MEDSLQPAGIEKPYPIHPAGISNLRQSLTPPLPSAVRLDKTAVKGDKGLDMGGSGDFISIGFLTKRFLAIR